LKLNYEISVDNITDNNQANNICYLYAIYMLTFL